MSETVDRLKTIPESGAFNRALAGESIPDGLHEYLRASGKFDDKMHELLVEYAQTVAYKVYHNLRCGHEMDMAYDPLQYVDCGSNVALSHENFNDAIQEYRQRA